MSYQNVRAENLDTNLGNPALASKETRTTMIAIAGILSGFFTFMPMFAHCYLFAHTNVAVLYRILSAGRSVTAKRPLL